MTKLRRVYSAIAGTLMIIAAVIMFRFSTDDLTYSVIIVILGAGLLVSGLSTLIYYFTMARFMVGGKASLYRGVILVDFAVLTLSFSDIPRGYILVYLAVIHAFTGMVEILRANESRRYQSRRYMLKFLHGVINISIAISCIVYAKKTNTAVIIYCLGLVYSGIIRIFTAFRKETYVYIQ